MGARDKLNSVVVSGCLIVSAILGAIMESWGAFWGVLIVLIGVCFSAGGIRTHPGARPQGKVRRGEPGRHPMRGRRG